MPEGESQGQSGGTQGASGGTQGQGSAIQDWRAGLPEEIRGEKSLESFKDVGGLAKSYVEAQKMIGGSVRVPKDDAKPEEWDAFYKKIGKPEKPEDYAMVKPAEMPEGVTWNDELVGWFGKTAHAAGLNKSQVQKIMTAWNDMEFTRAHENQKKLAVEMGKLQTEWGNQFDGRVELGVRGIERLLKPEEAEQLKDVLSSTGLGNNPLLIKYAYLVGNMLKEDGYIIGDGAGGALGIDAAQAKIDAINADNKHPYWNDGPGHKEAVEEMKKLFELTRRRK